jgi:hypothetical protein
MVQRAGEMVRERKILSEYMPLMISLRKTFLVGCKQLLHCILNLLVTKVIPVLN